MKIRPTNSSSGPLCGQQVATSDCEQKNVRVCVDGVEIPTVDARSEDDQAAVEVQIRKDGPGKFTRISDVYFPARWKGEDVFSYLPFGPEDESVPVKIAARPLDGGDWQTIHYGWLRKIGSGGRGRLMRMRVDDYVKLLESTFVSETFRGTVTTDDVLDFVESELIAQKGIVMDTIGDEFTVQRPNVDRPDGEITASSSVREGIVDTRTLPNPKTFDSHRDTLVDVLDWLVDQVDGGYWYVGANGDEPAIVVGTDFDPTWSSIEAGGNTVIRKNMAMQDINPVNAVRVVGQTGFSIRGRNINLSLSPSKQFPVAEATYGPLLRRANFVKHSKRFEIEATTEAAAASKAKQLLVEEIEGAGEASMLLNGNPSILPHGTIYARPVCNEYVEGDVPVIGYGIERVTHTIPATGRYTTEVDVGMQVDEDLLSVTAETMGKSTGEETADDIFSDEDLEDEEILRSNLP